MSGEQLSRAQDRAVAAAADRQLSPHPGGLAGRVADAQQQAEEAIAAGTSTARSAPTRSPPH